MQKVNLAQKLATFEEHWSPKIVGDLNGQHVKLAKLQGEFVWHHHEHEDELFLVLNGRLVIELRDGQIVLEPGGEVIVEQIGKGLDQVPAQFFQVCGRVLSVWSMRDRRQPTGLIQVIHHARFRMSLQPPGRCIARDPG